MRARHARHDVAHKHSSPSHLQAIYRQLVENINEVHDPVKKEEALMAVIYSLLKDATEAGFGNNTFGPEWYLTAIILLDEKLREMGYESVLAIPSSARDTIITAATPYLERRKQELFQDVSALEATPNKTQAKAEGTNLKENEVRESSRRRWGESKLIYLSYIEQGLTVNEIADRERKKRNIHPNTPYVTIRGLKKEGLIEEDSDGRYILTDKGKKVLKYLKNKLGYKSSPKLYNTPAVSGEQSKDVREHGYFHSEEKSMMEQDEERPLLFAYELRPKTNYESLVMVDDEGRHLELMNINVPDRKKGSSNKISLELIFLQVIREIEKESGQITFNEVYEIIRSVPSANQKVKNKKVNALFELISRGVVVDTDDGAKIESVYEHMFLKAKKDMFGERFDTLEDIHHIHPYVLSRNLPNVGEVEIPPLTIFAILVRNWKKACSGSKS